MCFFNLCYNKYLIFSNIAKYLGKYIKLRLTKKKYLLFKYKNNNARTNTNMA